MRAVIQRVSEASVTINHEIHGQINQGLMVLLGIEENDKEEDFIWLSKKIIQLRIFNDENHLMNLALKDIEGDLLLISQFTLYASTVKGNRPSFIQAARPEQAIPLYEKMIQQLTLDLGKSIQKGQFGADMKVQLINDGPVTIIIDTKNKM